MKILDDFTKCDNDVKLNNRVALVTGSTSGVGVEIAKNLANRGAKVILASRSDRRLAETRDKIINETGNFNIVGRRVDFESLTSVRSFVHEMYMYEPRLDIIINNVGAIGLENRLTDDSLNVMMQVNYFAPFLLTFLLYPLLKSSASSRIVNVTTLAQILGHINIDHLNEGNVSSFKLYSNAKLAFFLFTVEMNKRIKVDKSDDRVSIYSMDPGLGKTDFFRNYEDTPIRRIFSKALLTFGRPQHRVATASVFLAIDPRVSNSSGKHFRDCSEFFGSWFEDDAELTRRLWEQTKRLVQITKEEDWEKKESRRT